LGSSDTLTQAQIDKLLDSLNSGLQNSETSTEDVSFETVSSPAELDFSYEYEDDEDKKGFKLYNFRRPDKFSKDHLRALMDIHKEFSRQVALVLSAYLRMHLDVEIISVDQLTYDEFARSMPSTITVGILELSPLPGQILLGISHEVTSSIVDRMLGGTGNSEIRARELTDVEEALAKKIIDKITKTLEASWKNIFPVQGKIIGLDSSYSFIQIASPGEIVALITFEVQISNRFTGLLSLCFPYPVLETVIGQLSTQHIFQAKGIITSAEDRQKVLDKLAKTNVKSTVLLGSTVISVQDMVDLKVGDVLRLDTKVEDNLVVKINNIPKFLGRPGTLKNKIAINIVDNYNEINMEE